MAGKPGYLWSLLTQKCPRCRKGSMFTDPNPWHLKSTLKMPPRCTECGQLFELEVGFWYGTAYLSYADYCAFLRDQFFSLVPDHRFLTDAISGSSGGWVSNGVLLVVLQPWFMRLSRAMYLYFFVSYNADYKNTAPKTFDYKSEDYFLREEQNKPS